MKKIIFLLSFLFLFSTAGAQGIEYELVSYTPSNSAGNFPLLNLSFLSQPKFTIAPQNFTNAWQFFFDLLIGVSIATAVLVFMYGAWEGIISGDSANAIAKGKDRMKNAIIGLMVVLSTWLIINSINPDLLRLPILQGLDKIGTQNQGAGAQQNVVGEQFIP
jgi:hypothetical protein